MKFKNYIIQFGGILEITKESEDIYVYNIPTKEWKLIDCTLGPLNLEAAFQQVIPLDMNPSLSTHLKMNHSSPNIQIGGSSSLKQQLNAMDCHECTKHADGLEGSFSATIDVAGKGA